MVVTKSQGTLGLSTLMFFGSPILEPLPLKNKIDSINNYKRSLFLDLLLCFSSKTGVRHFENLTECRDDHLEGP